MCSMSEDVHYNGVSHHILVQGSTTQKYFPMNKLLLFLMYQVKNSFLAYGSLQKSIIYEIVKEIFSF